ncbi:MAG: hypothetical protein WBD40_02000, partial [Tepidisphaeraceae bacterium]
SKNSLRKTSGRRAIARATGAVVEQLEQRKLLSWSQFVAMGGLARGPWLHLYGPSVVIERPGDPDAHLEVPSVSRSVQENRAGGGSHEIVIITTPPTGPAIVESANALDSVDAPDKAVEKKGEKDLKLPTGTSSKSVQETPGGVIETIIETNEPTGPITVGARAAAIGDFTVDLNKGGKDTIQGGSGNDSLVGQGGDDVLNGNGNNDTLRGEAGADTIISNDGIFDIADGGSDSDTGPNDVGIDTIISIP